MAPSNSDRWQWLEDQLAPECLEWVDRQNDFTKRYLDALPEVQDLESMLQRLAAGDARNPDYWIAGRLFRLLKSNEHKQGVLEVSNRLGGGSLGDWRKVIDIDELGRVENRNYELQVLNMTSYVLGPDSSRLIVPLSIGGSDVVRLREVDMATGEVLEKGFRTEEEGRVRFTWIDEDHILIAHSLNHGIASSGAWPRSVYLWKRGDDLKNAKPVWQAHSTDVMVGVSTIITQNKRYGLIVRVKDYSSFEHFVVTPDGQVRSIPLPEKQPMKFVPASTAEHVLGVLLERTLINGREYPVETVVACSIRPGPNFGELSVVYIPQSGEANTGSLQGGLQAGQSRVYVTLTRRGTERCVVLECRDGDWVAVESHDTKDGHHRIAVSCDPYSNDIIVEESGLVSAKQIWLQQEDRTTYELHQQVQLLDRDAFEVRNGIAHSSDGTEVDYVTVSRRPTAGHHCIMTGYGAFGFCFPKTYLDFMHGGISLVPWLNSGGTFAIPFIRGGGETGEEGHQAARQKNRQRSYDDFIAVAEELIRTNFTAAGKIGVFGSSNGGLLTAVLGTQRPDLFGAVVSDVPITDMLTFGQEATGAAFVAAHEYGDPSDPEIKDVLLSYSPYHNVKQGVNYPPFLVTASAKDDRVGTGHARKFVARLQEVGAREAYLFESDEGGHMMSDAYKASWLLSRRVAFFLHNLR